MTINPDLQLPGGANTINEMVLDATIRHQIHLLRMEGSVRNQVFALLDASEKELVWVGRLSTLLLMVLAAFIALALSDALSTFNILLQIGGLKRQDDLAVDRRATLGIAKINNLHF